MFDFEAWVKEEYAKYGADTINSIINYWRDLISPQDRGHFRDHIRSHHNNAFESESEWKREIKCRRIASDVPGEAAEVLAQLIESPKFDGDVVSKNGKAWLYDNGLAIRIANGGTFGDNAATYAGWRVHNLINPTDE